MISTTGTIVRIEQDEQGEEWAVIEVARQHACGHCEVSSGCGTGTLAKLFARSQQQVRVRNTQRALPGSQVQVNLSEGALVQMSLFAYLLPLFTLFIGGAIYSPLANLLGLPNGEGMTVLSALVGLGIGFYLLAKLGKRLATLPSL